MIAPTKRRRGLPGVRRGDDSGAAIVEFVLLFVMLMVPLFYLAIAAFDVQANVFATTQAAREAGRAVATAPDLTTGVLRAEYAVRLALNHQGDGADAVLRFVPSGDSCLTGVPAPDPGAASIEPGAVFTVCVANRIDIVGVPGWLEGGAKTFIAQYGVRIDALRVNQLEVTPGAA